MNRILIAGCGDIAARLLPLFPLSDRVYALMRDPAKAAKWRATGAHPILGDLDDRRSLHRLAGLADIVLHLAPPPALGARDTRTRNLLAALSQGRLPVRLIYISTSGVYGDCLGGKVDETRRVHPQTARAQRRVDAEQQIRAWARRNGVQACILRVPGIYAAERLPLERIRQGLPAIASTEDSYTNHIHADDLASIVLAALRRGKPNRVYHTSDDGPMKMGDYFDAIADACGLARPPRVSREEAQRQLPAAMWSFLNESRRLSNARLKHELGVRLQYPEVRTLLDTLRANSG